jgi:hypothetical protein
VGRCPACGNRFEVPGDPDGSARVTRHAPEEVLPERAPVGPSAFVSAFGSNQGRRGAGRFQHRDGLIRPPGELETRLRDSLLYPLWGGTGLSLLLTMPPLFWLTSLPTISVIAALLTEGVSATTRFGVMFLLPVVPCFAFLLSYTLLYLGRVLVSSALGETHHPRWPSWDLEEMVRGIFRWIWAAAVGVVLGGVPAVAYWVICGDLDPLDLVILVELFALGAVYAQMALLASILHDDPLGANPITVIQGIIRIGWSYLRPCLVSGAFLVLGIGAFAGVCAIAHPLLTAVALWAFWVMILYLAMVALRVLGLCYHHRSRALGWFGERPRWGV